MEAIGLGFGEQFAQMAPDRLPLRQAEVFGGAAVPAGDDALEIGGDDGVPGLLDNARLQADRRGSFLDQPFQAQALFLGCLLGLLAFGQVESADEQYAIHAFAENLEAYLDRVLPALAILVQGFEKAVAAFPLDSLDLPARIVGLQLGIEIHRRHALELLEAVAQSLAGAAGSLHDLQCRRIDQVDLLLGVAQQVIEHHRQSLGLVTVGHVFHRGPDVAFAVALDDLTRQAYRHPLTVAVDVFLFVGPVAAGGLEGGQLFPLPFLVFARGDLPEGHAEHFVDVVTDNLGIGRVDFDQPALQVGQGQPDGRVLNQHAQVGFPVLQQGFELLPFVHGLPQGGVEATDFAEGTAPGGLAVRDPLAATIGLEPGHDVLQRQGNASRQQQPEQDAEQQHAEAEQEYLP